MKNFSAGIFVLLVAFAGLFAIVDLAPYLTERNEKLINGTVPLTEDQREGNLDRARQPQGKDAPPGVAELGNLALLPPANTPEGKGEGEAAPAPLATGVKETPGATPVASITAQPTDAPADAETGDQPVKIAEPKQAEVFGLLTDTGETEENQIIDLQSAQTAMVSPRQRAQRAKVPAARQMIKESPRQPVIRSTLPAVTPKPHGADGPPPVAASPRGSVAGG